MILQELVRYYERLAKQGVQLPKAGFSSENIHFALVLDRDGNFVQIDDLRTEGQKTPTPIKKLVPFLKRTSGITPYFLWDKAEYVFGVVPKDKEEIKKEKSAGDWNNIAWKINTKSTEKFNSFKEKHCKAMKEAPDAHLAALVNFLTAWTPDRFSEFGDICNELVNGNVVVQILGSNSYLHEQPNLQAYWERLLGDPEAEKGICLVTGQPELYAQLHAGIKGVPGAQSSGAPVISYNKESFCSYNRTTRDQAKSSSIGQYAASAYTAVLNYLLQFESRQKIQIADATTLFWGEKDDSFNPLFRLGLTSQDDDGSYEKLQVFLSRVRKGELPDDIDGKQRFYILGLSPNAARLSVRFWYANTIENISRQFAKHFDQLAIVRQSDKQHLYPGLWWLLVETAAQHKTANIPPNLTGPFMMAILKGTPYPMSLLSILLERLRVEKDPNYYKCALIKAILIRNYRKEVSVSLNRERNDEAYVLGRLFAVLEKIQLDSITKQQEEKNSKPSNSRKINATIMDKYFASASVNPSVTFPLLLRLSNYHQKKLRSEKPGLAINRQKEMQEIMGMLSAFPKTLTLEDQGMFVIGYYHQYQSFFEKRGTEAGDANAETEA